MRVAKIFSFGVASFAAIGSMFVLDECRNLKPYNDLHQKVLEFIIDPSELPNLRFYEGFVSSLNYAKRVPNVVIEQLQPPESYSRSENGAVADRKNSWFTAQHCSVPAQFAAPLEAYRGSGYSRGHMAAAGNFKNVSQLAMDETFVLGANIIPQEGRNNGNFWFRMEMLTRRDLPQVLGNEDAFVLSGPLYLPTLAYSAANDPDKGISRYRQEKERKYMNHEVLEDQVHVPTHLFKVMVVKREELVCASAFIISNGPQPVNQKLMDVEVPLEELEKKAGFRVLPNEQKPVRRLCGDVMDCEQHFMNADEYQTFLLGRKLGWAKTESEMTAEYEKAKSKGVFIDDYSKRLYEKKRRQFQEQNNK